MDNGVFRVSNESRESQRNLERRLRQKERKHYTEDCINDEEIEGKRMFSVEEKLVSDKYNANFVQEMKGEDVCLNYFQEHGFLYPIVIKDKAGLGMRLPSQNFTVNDVRQCVGSRRMLDVMDVTTQKDIEMSMKDWVKYFENPQRDKLLNVISLEFSHTKLENYIESPKLVREIDWVDTVWPTQLKQSQTESTNIIDDMKYPKVQKYCLMSVKGCYTDFHIDFGGTSVWYHILHGRKVFWLIPPTEINVQLYEQWVLSGKQGDVFFGDTVDECGRIELEAGWTFFIPTGWIHAVYTPADSLVFGGNFLHNFGIEKQLRIAQVEDVTHVPNKFRYPFYTEMLWYVLARYVDCLFGISHYKEMEEEGNNVKDGPEKETLATSPVMMETNGENGAIITPPDSPMHPLQNHHPAVMMPFTEKAKSPPGPSNADRFDNVNPTRVVAPLDRDDIDDSEGKENRWSPMAVMPSPFETHLEESPASVKPPSEIEQEEGSNVLKKHIHLTRFEINGIKAIVRWLANLPPNKRNVPELIKDPSLLLQDVKLLLEQHHNDDPKMAITGKPLLVWPDIPKKLKLPKQKAYSVSKSMGVSSSGKSSGGSNSSKASSSARRRRTRCKKCEACLRADCGDCHFCKDMKKFGGPGRMKQSCISRQCMAPVLPHTACCMICGKDGWEKGMDVEEEASTLMECSICWEIVHPECLIEKAAAAAAMRDDGTVCDDLPNSWECPKCCQLPNGKGGPAPKLRQIRPHKPRNSMDVLSSTLVNINGIHHLPGKRSKDASFGDDCDQLDDRIPGPSHKRKKMKVEGDGERIKSSNSDSDGENGYKKEKKKSLDGRSKKRKSSRGKSEGESHVRSCVRQPLVGAYQEIMSSTGEEVKYGSTDHFVEEPQPKPPLPLNGLTDLDADRGCLRGLMNCQIKVLKCDDATDPIMCHNLPIASSPTSSSCAVVSGPLTSPVRNGPKPVDVKKKIPLRKPMYVVRPAPILEPKERTRVAGAGEGNSAMDKDCMLCVFRHLRASDLCKCMLVCKTWNAWCLDKRLWSRIDLAQRKIAAQHLAGIVRRQPSVLGLGWTNISKKLLTWLMQRLPQLRSLDLSGCSWASVSALVSSSCPTLNCLDLKWVEGMTDGHLRELLSPPPDSRPGLLESKSRLRNLLELRLSGCEVSDVALRYVTQYLRLLSKLDLSRCVKISDAGIALLTAVGSPTRETLTHLDLSGCKRLTDNCLEHLRRCPILVCVDLRNCPDVSITACRKFIAQSKQPLMMAESKLINKQVNYLHPSFQHL